MSTKQQAAFEEKQKDHENKKKKASEQQGGEAKKKKECKEKLSLSLSISFKNKINSITGASQSDNLFAKFFGREKDSLAFQVQMTKTATSIANQVGTPNN